MSHDQKDSENPQETKDEKEFNSEDSVFSADELARVELNKETQPHQAAVTRIVLYFIAFATVLAATLYFYQIFFVPIILSTLFCYLAYPLFKLLIHFRFSRALAALFIVVLGFGVIGLAVLKIFPAVYDQFLNLSDLVFSSYEAWKDILVEKIRFTILQRHLMTAVEFDAYWSKLDLLTEMGSKVEGTMMQLLGSIPQVFGGVLNIVMLPIISFFILKDFPKLSQLANHATPNDLQLESDFFIQKLDSTLKSVIKGQVTVAFILGLLYTIGFSSIGMHSAVAVGLAAGICRLVPYLDIFVGGFLSAIVLSAHDGSTAQYVGVAIIITVVQVLDALFITPKVIGERAGLHPLVVIFSVMAFAHWFGFMGVILAIPTIAILKVVVEFIASLYLRTLFFKQK
ncbi:MAG: AI-2E family transporter [Oligoflexales bacterium]|nr:AI-2E family transporter [Oligoflexales bacterium]